MNSELFNKLKNTSDDNYDSKEQVREEHARSKDKEYELRDYAMSKAANELFNEIVKNDLIDKLHQRSNDGYYDMLMFSVSLDPSMDHFASHENGKPYVTTEYEGKQYSFTYRALFWTQRWKELCGPFQMNYRWNKPQTLLSVYASWSR